MLPNCMPPLIVIATIDLAAARLKPLHRLTDNAWINNSYNEFGWLPDSRTLWFLSEESGYSHLYTLGADGRQRALTSGKWEATQVSWNSDGTAAWVMCNRKTPGQYEVCAVSPKDGSVREVTQLGGGVDPNIEAVVRTRPDLAVQASQTTRNLSWGTPQTCSTTSGV